MRSFHNVVSLRFPCYQQFAQEYEIFGSVNFMQTAYDKVIQRTQYFLFGYIVLALYLAGMTWLQILWLNKVSSAACG